MIFEKTIRKFIMISGFLFFILFIIRCASYNPYDPSRFSQREGIPQFVSSSVVRIHVSNQPGKLFEDINTATGFCCGSPGYVITCAHVIKNTNSCIIHIETGGKKYRAKIITMDDDLDAVILFADNYDSLSWPKSAVLSMQNPALGSVIYITGYPKNEHVKDSGFTVTSGIVSAKDRILTNNGKTRSPLIQTDAYTHDGFSGSPVTNSRGEVIGMVNYILSTEQGIWLGATYVTPSKELNELITKYCGKK